MLSSALPAKAAPDGPETLTEWLRAEHNVRDAGLRSCLERIEMLDGSIQAWVEVLPQKPTGSGRLSGIPFAAKDIIETRGLATEYGSPIYKGRTGTTDAVIIQQLRAEGAVLLGKTQTAAFAMRDPAPTRNPRNVEHTPGGSSSGSAAAVAAGMVPFALGTQTSGSVLRPASYCGVTGFKPTYGLLPLDGVLPCAKSLDTLGFFTHTPVDMLSLWEALGYSSGTEQDTDTGIPESFSKVEPAMSVAFQNTVATLRKAGVRCRVIDMSAMLTKLDEAQQVVLCYEAARFHQSRFKQFGDRLGYVATVVREGMQIPEARYLEAQEFIAQSRRRMKEIYSATPILLVPAATGPAPSGLSYTGDTEMNTPWTALGTPAISVPMPVSADALPLGLQVTAAPGEDWRVLRAAVRLHRILNN